MYNPGCPWNSLCSPGWAQIQRSFEVCLSTVRPHPALDGWFLLSQSHCTWWWGHRAFFSEAGEMIPSRAPTRGAGGCVGLLAWSQEAETEGFWGLLANSLTDPGAPGSLWESIWNNKVDSNSGRCLTQTSGCHTLEYPHICTHRDIFIRIHHMLWPISPSFIFLSF